MADEQRGTKVMPENWNVIEEIYEDAPSGAREERARDISHKMGLTIIEFLQAHPDQHFTFCYRVSRHATRNDLLNSIGPAEYAYQFNIWDNVVERRCHSIDVAAVETLHEMRALPTKSYGDMSRVALSRSALEEIRRRMRGKWLRIKSTLRRQ